jgi:hypothetical protein
LNEKPFDLFISYDLSGEYSKEKCIAWWNAKPGSEEKTVDKRAAKRLLKSTEITVAQWPMRL